MRIGEFSRRTEIPARLLRYYEEQGLLRPDRAENGYRDYDESAVLTAQQIRGLLDSGLPTRIIRLILPCLDRSPDHQVRPKDLPPEITELMRQEAGQIQTRIDCLTQNLDAIQTYLSAIPERDAARE